MKCGTRLFAILTHRKIRRSTPKFMHTFVCKYFSVSNAHKSVPLLSNQHNKFVPVISVLFYFKNRKKLRLYLNYILKMKVRFLA